MPRHDDDKRVIPVRNPFGCYMSWQHLHPGRDLESMALWGRLIWRSQEGGFFFPLDIAESRRDEMLLSAMKYAGLVMDKNKVSSFEWVPENASGRPVTACPVEIKKLLSFAEEWYEHHTKFWGC